MLLSDALMSSVPRPAALDPVGVAAARAIARHAGQVSIDGLARAHGLSRHHFTRRFRAATGLPPKQFARLSRFQALVPALLSTDVGQWARLAPVRGFYDQAHMINEFRALTGQSPTAFFHPHTDGAAPLRVIVRGRPNQWCSTAPERSGTSARTG